MPAIIPAPGHSSSYMPSAASGANSRNGTAGVEQAVHPVARQQLAAADVALAGAFRTAERRGGQLGAQLVDQREVLVAM